MATWLNALIPSCLAPLLTALLFTIPGAAQAEQPVVRAADQKGLQRALLQASHALDGASYQIEWSEFPAAAPLLQAVSAGAVDTGIAGGAPFLFAYAAGQDVRATVAMLPRDAGRNLGVIVPANSPIRRPADLAGRRVATGRGSIGHELLLRLQQSGAVSGRGTQIVFLSPAQSAAALHSGGVDAWSGWEPYLALEQQNGARVVAYGTGLAANYSFEVSNSAAIAGKHAVLADFYHRLALAFTWGQAHPAAYAALWSQQMGLPAEMGERVAGAMLTRLAAIDPGAVAAVQGTAEIFQHAGALPALRAPIAAAFDHSFTP